MWVSVFTRSPDDFVGSIYHWRQVEMVTVEESYHSWTSVQQEQAWSELPSLEVQETDWEVTLDPLLLLPQAYPQSDACLPNLSTFEEGTYLACRLESPEEKILLFTFSSFHPLQSPSTSILLPCLISMLHLYASLIPHASLLLASMILHPIFLVTLSLQMSQVMPMASCSLDVNLSTTRSINF